jgi:multiple sugar transport system permease protein
MLIHNRNRWAYFFVAPLVIVMLAVFLYPIVRVAMMSAQDWYMIRPATNGKFVGFDNYSRMFGERSFDNSVRVSLIYILVTVPARFLLGFATALLLNQKFKGRAIARAIVIIPWAVPEAVTCLVWILMYDRDFGIINAMLRDVGMIYENIGYLQNRAVALHAAMVVNIWKGFPFVAIMLLAGLQGIPSELYEASKVDGSNAWQRLRHITIPMLKPVSMIVFLLLVIWTIRDFGIVYLLARGGPSQATEVLTVYLYHAAFTRFDFGLASAGGVLMLLCALLFSFLYIRMLNREERAL